MTEMHNTATERLDRFEMFRQSLSKEERYQLDNYVVFVIASMKKRGARNFGIIMAQELIMALIDFQAGLPESAARKGAEWKKRH